MTITDVHPSTLAPVTDPGPDTAWTFTRLAGPFAVLAGVLMTVGQLLWMPFDAKDWENSSTDVVFQTGSVIYLLGFVALLLAAIGLASRQAGKAGRFGLIAACLAVVGTMVLGGDLWFEAFVVPWLASGSQSAVLDSDPSALLGLGALSSYALFAIGWCTFGIASYRSGVFPKALCVTLAVTGAIGFSALLAPFGLPLALTVGALGVWNLRHPSHG
jgi:hypothetical protein